MRTPRVAIIGAGMSGLCMAAQLKRAGVDTFEVFEKADRLGGTWRDNTYPGVACDIPSLYYSYTFAPRADWSRVFSPGGEIWSYLEDVADREGLRDHVSFGSEVRAGHWVQDHWELDVDGEVVEADFVVAATGVLHHPRLPDLPGLDEFAGASFHSGRWDHDVPLDGRRVGIIGSGSTGVQIVTALAGRAAPLVSFQRSPQWVLPSPNPHVGPALQRLLRRPRLREAVRRGFQETLERSLFEAVLKPGLRRRAIGAGCRWNLRQVRDPALRERLTPRDEPMCRRLIVADGYYEALQRPDVEVVRDAIARVEARGVRTEDGRLHELDVLVLATGYDPGAFLRPIELVGTDGLTLEQAWAGGARGYRSVALPRFPNLFTPLGPHSPFGNQSQITVAEAQVGYAMGWIERWRRGEVEAAAPRQDATDAYNDELRAAMREPGIVWTTGCQSWYLGEDGLPALWPWSAKRHRELLAETAVDDWELVRTA